MKWIAVTYIIYLVLLSVGAFSLGAVDYNPVVSGAVCCSLAGALTVVTDMIADAMDFYFDWS